jgi:hypothetical protein
MHHALLLHAAAVVVDGARQLCRLSSLLSAQQLQAQLLRPGLHPAYCCGVTSQLNPDFDHRDSSTGFSRRNVAPFDKFKELHQIDGAARHGWQGVVTVISQTRLLLSFKPDL